MRNILLSLALAAPAALALDGITFNHEDWTLSCDNIGTCRAAGYQSEPGIGDEGYPEPVSLLLTRKAGADAEVEAQLQIIPDEKDGKTIDTKGVLQLNGKTLGEFVFAVGHSADTLDDKQAQALLVNGVVMLDDRQTQAILAALPKDKAEIVVKAGERTMTLSDKGAAAVLLKMDEFQKRTDTPSALIKKGNSQKAVLEPVPAPKIHAVVPKGEIREIKAGSKEHAQLMQHFGKDFDPENGEEVKCLLGEGEIPEFTLYPLNNGQVLSETRCWTAAYNGANHYVVLSDDLHSVVGYIYGSVAGDGFNLNDYNPGAGILSGSFKGRGIGDCWDGESLQYDGNTFVPAAKSSSGMCRGFPGGAWEMPTLVSEIIGQPENEEK